jgi:hypothetical protein
MARLAPQLDVMHLQVSPAAAALAPPAVPLEHLMAQLFVCFRIEPQAWALCG